MRDNPVNCIKLWWHCLIHWHRECQIGGGSNPEIGCYDCDYGVSEPRGKSQQSINLMERKNEEKTR
jgi:hypothetical protein